MYTNCAPSGKMFLFPFVMNCLLCWPVLQKVTIWSSAFNLQVKRCLSTTCHADCWVVCTGLIPLFSSNDLKKMSNFEWNRGQKILDTITFYSTADCWLTVVSLRGNLELPSDAPWILLCKCITKIAYYFVTCYLNIMYITL